MNTNPRFWVAAFAVVAGLTGCGGGSSSTPQPAPQPAPVPTSHSLTITTSGAGIVTSAPAGIQCGSTCNASYTSGTTVTLTATPGTGNTFTGWSGACTGTGSCTVAMNANLTVTATYATSTSAGCTGAKHTPGGPDGAGGCWPGPLNTGVPVGTVLTVYTDPCTITMADTVIDSKTVNCDLIIRASNVQIRKSKINGFITSGDDKTSGYSFTVSDSEINASPNGPRAVTAVGEVNFTVIRSHVYGGNRSAHCWYMCDISDSYFHGQDKDVTGQWHESGIRTSEGANLVHNSIGCDAPDVEPDAGCSADITSYGDFGIVQNNTIDNNLLLASPGGYCIYGGSVPSKQFPHANHIVYTNNVWQRGPNGKCGSFGPVTNFDPAEPGNVWTNNKWDDGTVLESAN